MEPILYIGISQAFFAGLFIAVKKDKSIADNLLATLLFLIAIDMSFSLLKSKFIFFQEVPPVLPLAYGPFVFLYVKNIISEKSSINSTSLLHFIPFISFFIATIIFIDKPLLPENNFFENDRFLPYRITYGFTFFIINTVYAVISFVLVYKHQRNLKNVFSYTSEKITLNWLKVVLFSFLIAYIMLYISGAWYLFKNKSFYGENINPIEFSYIGLTFFAFAFSFFGFRQLNVFKPNIEEKKPKYSSSNLTKKDAEKYLKELQKVMQNEKPYLNEKLSISELAEDIGISRHHLTQIINEHLNKNFYTFINEYRIKDVKKMLHNKNKKYYSILAIAYECGFNSKSTFNTLFKKFTGKTPSEFRNLN